MNTYIIYLMVFCLSFLILSLQIVLAILFESLATSPILAISFAFMGLSIGGAFSYIKYFKKESASIEKCFLFHINLSGILLLLYVAAIKYYSLITFYKGELIIHTIWHKQLAYIFITSLLLGSGFAILFFSFGLVISLIYRQYSDKANILFLFDLIGAACGCVFGVIILNFLQVSSVLILFSIFVFLISILLNISVRKRINNRQIPVFIFFLIAIFCFFINLQTDFFEPKLNPLFFTVGRRDTKELWHRWNAYSRISLFRHKGIKDTDYRYSLFINNLTERAKLFPFNPDNPYDTKSFHKLESASPVMIGFLLKKPKDILILCAGAGADMLEAYSYSSGESNITGVELNPLIVEKAISLSQFNLKKFFAEKNVRLVVQEGRSYLETTDNKFDAIIIPSSSKAMAYALGIPNYNGQYLYTKEAFVNYLKHLKADGIIVITSFNKIRIIATVKEAFKQLGFNNFANTIIIFDNKNDIASGAAKKRLLSSAIDNEIKVLIKKSDFSRDEIDIIKKKIFNTNQEMIYNGYYTHKDFKILEDLIKVKNTTSFLDELSKQYHFSYVIPTDNKPFIKNMFLMSGLFNLNSLIAAFNTVFLYKYRFFAEAFWILIFCSSVFLLVVGFLSVIIVPFILRKNVFPKKTELRVLFYFALLGLGFIFVEIGVMHIFTLFLGNPIYAFSIVLASLLLSTALGGFLSQYLFSIKQVNIRKLSVCSFCLLSLYFLFLPQINKNFLYINFPLKLVIAFSLIFPIGASLGMFFPQGLRKIYDTDKYLIPLAWGLNGYMSIVGSVLSPYLAWSMGFSSFLLVAAILYLTIGFIKIKQFN